MPSSDLELKKSTLQLIQDMSVAEKMDLARKGSKEERTILMRDANRLVQLAVVQSPKITDAEVLQIAGNRQVDDDALRFIASKKEWLKNYQVTVALTTNPKTPLAIALKLVGSLRARDLEHLTRSKGVPRALAVAARQRLLTTKK